MKFNLHSTIIIYGLLLFVAGAHAAPVVAREVSASHDFSSRALFSGESELTIERALLPEDSVLEERMGDIAYDEEVYGRADDIHDLLYRSPSFDAIPTSSEQQTHAPHPHHGQGQANHLVQRGFGGFMKKVWGGVKKVAPKAIKVAAGVAAVM